MRIVSLHYTAPPVIGGVEAVIRAHARCLLGTGHTVVVIAGEGAGEALAQGADFVGIPELASQHPVVRAVSAELEQGRVPAIFEALTMELAGRLRPLLQPADWVVVHNVFTKHFNLPLTAALHRLLDRGGMGRCIAWCHDFSWTSPHSRSKLHSGYPWDLLKTYRSDVAYVTVSQRRQRELAGLLHCPADRIRVIYNGVDPGELLGLSAEGQSLADGFDLGESDLVMLMPVRVTQAKNIEYALRVVEALKSRGLRPRLIVTGPPDPHDAQNLAYYHSLLELRRQLGIEHEARFVCETGRRPDQLRLVDPRVVGDLFRVSDVLFMPSHREGFGMPVVEAGLAGLGVFCAAVPAAEELGGEDVTLFSADDAPVDVAARLVDWAESNAVHRLRRRVRQTLTWDRLFQRDILPWLEGSAS
jgi:mannosylglucosylglycerate synthase